MHIDKLEGELDKLQRRGISAQVVVIDQANGLTYDIDEVELECHDEADGSHTVWLRVSET